MFLLLANKQEVGRLHEEYFVTEKFRTKAKTTTSPSKEAMATRATVTATMPLIENIGNNESNKKKRFEYLLLFFGLNRCFLSFSKDSNS
mmetsp:Transcript_5630/g.13430  ORF Transcript_5630/g.13430 Transcript_5630/m.13430 type:complete len:89 (+) Transcript_5630:913-1179(+)